MYTRYFNTSFALLTLCFASTNASADEQRVQFAFDASAGIEYDSNVALQDLDASSGEADTATILDAGLDLTFLAGDNSSIRLGYDVSATAYRDFSEYDLTLHHFNADFGRRGKYLDVAIAGDRFEGILDGDDYVSYTQVSPSVSHLFGRSLFLRGAFVAGEKQYDELATRNADKDALRLDTYWLFDGMDRYLSVGLEKSSEEGSDPELDFEAALVCIAYTHTFVLPLIELQLKAQVRYEERDYLNVTQSIAAQRKDQRLRTALSTRIPFGDHVQLEANIEHTDNTSNLASAELDKLVLRIGLAVQF